VAKPDSIRPIRHRDVRIRACVYGDPGAGKTRLSGSSDKPTLIIRPPMDHTDSLAAVGSTADEWVVDSWNEMEEVNEYMRHEGQHEYEWFALDSISIWQDAGLDDVYEDMLARKHTERERQLRAQFGPDKGEYGVNMHRLAKWVRNICALDVNFIVTAHPFKDEDPDGDIVYMPWVQGKQMPEKICGYMNLVGYLTVREDKNGNHRRILITDRRDKWYAKDQFDAFDGLLRDPTLPRIEEGINKKLKPKTKSKPKKKAARKKAATKASDDVAWEE
jgi:hypothetical protein